MMNDTSLKKPVVLIGVGEMGAVFARGILSIGHPVFPVTRDTDLLQLSQQLPDPEMVLIAVGEKDLHATLEQLPSVWRHKFALLQNELLPKDWLQHQLSNPTIISVWFEKKPGQDSKVIIPSPAFGPQAELLHNALASINIPVTVVASREEMLLELVVKNLYILTTNIAGLEVGGNVEQLWNEHRSVAEAVATEVIALQEALTGENFDQQRLFQKMAEAFAGDPEHKCMGRSAPARLERALENAEKYSVEVPRLEKIKQQHG